MALSAISAAVAGLIDVRGNQVRRGVTLPLGTLLAGFLA